MSFRGGRRDEILPGLTRRWSGKRESVSPALLGILAEGFLSRLSFGVISFALPIFAYRRLGLSLRETGLLFSLNLVAEQLFKPLMGWVADHVGVKRTFTVAIALRSLVALLLAFAVSPWHVFAIRFLHGFSESMRDPSVNVLIVENANQRSLASAFGWYTTAKMSAGSIGRALGGALLALAVENYSLAFISAFALSILPLYVVMRYVREPGRHEKPFDQRTGDKAAAFEESRAKRKGIWSVAILGFLIASTAQMISNLFPILAMEYGGLSAGQMSLIYSFSIIVVVGAGPIFGWISDHVSRKLVLMVRGIANTCSSLLFLYFPGFTGMSAGNVVDAMGKAAFRPAWGSLMAQISTVDRRRRARVMSYLSLGEGLGETIGPLLGGFLWHYWGVGAMLGVRVALALIGEIYALVLSRGSVNSPGKSRD